MLRKVLTLMACMTVLGISMLSAKIWTVDSNQGNSAADFKTFQAAHDGADSGDTLYFSGSSITYGGVSLVKKLTIIGPGYFLTQNLDKQANPATAYAGRVDFTTGSAGSIMMGMEVRDGLVINASNITIKRNRIYRNNVAVDINPSYGDPTVSNVIIAQNYLFITYTSSSTSYKTINLNQDATGVFVTNNFINIGTTDPNGQYSIYTNATNTDIQVINNTIRGMISIGNLGNFNNNILREGNFGGGALTPRNNLADTTQFGTINGNQENVDMATVFDSTQTSADAKWMLAAASPAKAAGLNGEDLGMYGGMSPYVLSGIPPVPSIYHFTAPVSGSKAQGLPVRIKIRSNK